MKKAPLVIISLLILVCLSGCGKKTVAETKSYAANEITVLHINASSWNVALTAGSENAVDIDISGSISNGEEAPAISLSDGTLTILQVSEDSGKNEVALGKKGQITVTIPSELTVPIEINNGYGDMEINHISAPQFLLNNEAGYVNFTNFKADMTKMPARERRRIIGQNGHFPSVPSQTADAPRGFSLREKRSDQHRAGKQVWQLAGDDTQAGDTPL